MLRAAKATENADAISDAERRSDRVRAHIAHWFGESALTERGGWSDWALAGERYGSLTATVEAFASRHSDHGSGRSFYMFQSTLMHPSAASATAFSTRQPDGRLIFEDFNLTYMVRTVLNAAWSWRTAVGEYLDYHGWDSPELDAWWSHVVDVFTRPAPDRHKNS